MSGEDRMILERIDGHLSDISVAFGSIDAHLERLTEIARTVAALHLGFDPITGTELETEPGDRFPRHHGQEDWLSGEEDL